MKSMRSYLDGKECGNLLKEQWINDRLIGYDSDSMALGVYFEFILTGALPKSRVIPKPVMMVSGKDMMSEYRTAHRNATRIKEYFDRMGLVIIHYGKKWTKGRFEGTIDIVVECTKPIEFDGLSWKVGDKLVIDTKYSGLIDERWSEHGWRWTDQQKKYHGIQAKQYHYITGLPFYFLVVSSKNDIDVKLFFVPVDEDMVEAHLKEGNYLMKEFKLAVEVGLIARPEISKCLECPLKNECSDKHTFPHVEIVDLNITPHESID